MLSSSLFLLFLLSATASSTDFDFDTLTLGSLRLLGDAHLANGTVRLTLDLPVPNSGAGRALYSNPVRFLRTSPSGPSVASFSTFFSFSVTNLNPSSIGGGLAFLLSPNSDTVGSPGGFLGLGSSNGGFGSFVAVEFDTLMDVEFNDINGNHVGVDVGGVVSSRVADLGAIDVDLKTGNLINSWIDYDGGAGILRVSVSYSNLKPEQPVLSVDLDLSKYVGDYMFVGFSGSTQGSTETHSIEWWSFSSSFGSSDLPPPPTASLMNPAADSVSSSPLALAPSSAGTPLKNEKSSPSSSCNNQLCRGGPGAVAGVATAGAFFLAIFAGAAIWVYWKKVRGLKKSELLAMDVIQMPREFSFRELKSATKCFNANKIIGHGAFGTVYKGILPSSGDIVAVKRCSHNSQGKEEFLSELSIIGTLRHRNLLRLQGWCHEKGEILLVYDWMPNGSLDKALFESRITLPWSHRHKILIGVASALAYLHQECENQVIHRDIKTSNIMLDEGFNARLGDFGLARQIEHNKSPDATVAAGTLGYLAPEYILTGRANEKTDVFSYGAVVLEVASGRRTIEKESAGTGCLEPNTNLVEWVWSLHRDGRLLSAADERLGGEFDEDDMVQTLLIGLACSQPDPTTRPTMRAVIQMLVGEVPVPIVPKTKPSMSFSTSQLLLNLQDSMSDYNGMTTLSTSMSSDLSDNDCITAGDIV
ncbi:hypothetical protein MLD38_035678 [Melastoma candidum]|uniref:Uncharacterized protein n=1 Tax=Melastoma candidum TaxID=119954 RepID=A0ACB9LHM7_9MYRT|nr:hypothetical protein MLD38_035678 [Melastoma candidum]